MDKLQALNSLEVVDDSCCGDEAEYVLAEISAANIKVLLDAVFTAEQIDEAMAIARCPDRKACGDHVFSDGSDCEKFNQQVCDRQPTHADLIRSMSDEELAVFFAKVDAALYHADLPGVTYRGETVNENLDWLRSQRRNDYCKKVAVQGTTTLQPPITYLSATNSQLLLLQIS